jgi:HPr kinase/phosphorylase
LTLADATTLHASCVALDGRGLLILGPSGAGKSGLALQLMALGAQLVADDRCLVQRRDADLIASAAPNLSGLIEARGLGILHSPALPETAIHLVVDLAQPETERLPPRRSVTILDTTRDLVFGSQAAHFPAAVLCYLRHGRFA